MRGLVYGIAAVAAVGIMIVIANSGGSESDVSTAPATSVSADVATMEDAGTLTLAVPDMHCSVSCFPRVKKALEENEAIEEVALAPQKVDGIIDNRQVVIQYKAGFAVDNALKALATEGFTDSKLVQ